VLHHPEDNTRDVLLDMLRTMREEKHHA